MKQNEIMDLSDTQLRENLASERISFSKLKLSHAVSPLENPMQIRVTKKNIARLNTEIKKRFSKKLSK
ncbi:MAG: 50S ribosomal protein L29 [Bacteroidia bacterium]